MYPIFGECSRRYWDLEIVGTKKNILNIIFKYTNILNILKIIYIKELGQSLCLINGNYCYNNDSKGFSFVTIVFI